MITIYFNDTAMQIAEDMSLAAILQENGYKLPGFAVAINQCFIPRTDYTTTILHHGDTIKIVTAMQGG